MMLFTVWFGSELGWLTDFEIFCWISLLVAGVGYYYKTSIKVNLSRLEKSKINSRITTIFRFSIRNRSVLLTYTLPATKLNVRPRFEPEISYCKSFMDSWAIEVQKFKGSSEGSPFLFWNQNLENLNNLGHEFDFLSRIWFWSQTTFIHDIYRVATNIKCRNEWKIEKLS